MSYPSQSNFMFLNPFPEDEGTAPGSNNSSNNGQQQQQQQSHYAASTPGLVNDVVTGGGNAYFVNGQMVSNSIYPVSSQMLVDSHPPQQGTPVNRGASATLAAASTGGAVGSDRNKSPSSTRSATSSDYAQRRATHNAIERARRESLNGQFQDLASAVPALIHVRRPSKAIIVEKSLDYIRGFKEHLSNRDQYIKKLQLRNLALHDEVNMLRKQLGMEPISETGEGSLSEYSLPIPDDASTEQDQTSDASLKVMNGGTAGQDESQPQPQPRAGSGAARSLIAERRQQQQQLLQNQAVQHKRRQQSLDLGIVDGSGSGGRPSLRVHTDYMTSKRTNRVSPIGSSEGSSSPGHSPLQLSPLSAPILMTQAPQLPLVGNVSAVAAAAAAAAATTNNVFMTPTSIPPSLALGSSVMSIDTHNPSAAAVAAAAAFVAQQSTHAAQQQALAVMSSQFGSVMGMNHPSAISLPPAMQVNAMGYMTQQPQPQSQLHPGQPGPMGVLDMSKFTDVFAASTPSTTMATMSMMSQASDTSDAPLVSTSLATSSASQ
ncbi:hypothetical protein GGI15_004758 [Coemansia interrupta]|uniref:BHLH domain-containing protein n=1 Tax=Coemansia interrupta TaxID=1126814 RepID=A0A9W8H625_9FUNG|nr:hypothetical protein GGI15_004758 [Coemansia interrupta]